MKINKDYCLQIEIDDRKGISYHESLKQILRHDPDVIMVGEVRDEKDSSISTYMCFNWTSCTNNYSCK